MTPIQFVPIDVCEVIQVFETDDKKIVLDQTGKDVTNNYHIEIRRKGQTEMVLISRKTNP